MQDLQDPDKQLAQACANGSMVQAQAAILRGACDWNLGLGEAGAHGQLDMAKFMFSKGATDISTWNLSQVCKCGHTEVMELLIRVFKAMNIRKHDDYVEARRVAVEHRRTAIVKLLVATTRSTHKGLYYASYMGDEKYFSQLLSTYMDPFDSLPWQEMLEQAIEGGQMHMVKRILPRAKELLVKYLYNTLRIAYQTPYLEIIQLLESLATELPVKRLEWACRGGHKRVVKHVLSVLNNPDEKSSDFDWESACTEACQYGHLPVAKLIAKRAAKNKKDPSCWEWQDILDVCFESSNVETVKWVKSRNVNLILSLVHFETACDYDRDDLIGYFIQQNVFDDDLLLCYACQYDKIEWAKIALLTHALQTDNDLSAPMAHALCNERVTMVRLLVSKGCKDTIKSENKYFIIALYAHGIPTPQFDLKAQAAIKDWQEKINVECVIHMPVIPVLLDMIVSFC